jgi:DnaJ-class molecular chaperone
MTYYEILGVAKDAKPDEIKKAYRKLASQHHPDKGGDKTKFQEIQSAYDTLSDTDKRQQYDMQQNGFGRTQFHFTSGDMSHPDIADIFRGFGFGGSPFEFHQRPQQRRNKDLRIEIPVPLVTTLEEQTKTVQVKTTSGETTTVEVKIPRGITNGTSIRYSGLGDNLFNTIPRGDLYIQINVHNADNFIVNGIDLHTKISVNCLLATLGGKVTVDGLDGKIFELTLPAGAQPGMKFRLAEQGLYIMNSSQRGNLYVELAITVPQNLSQEQLDLVRSILNTQ